LIGALLLATFVGRPAFANDEKLAVSIVGLNQYQGLPLIPCPPEGAKQTDEFKVGDSLTGHFFVVIQNLSKAEITLSMWASDWDSALSFKITDGTGKVYTVTRSTQVYTVNGIFSQTIPAQGMDILPVDLTNVSSTGWKGAPRGKPPVKRATMTATFTCENVDPRTFKRSSFYSIVSTPTEVYLLF